MLSRFFIKRPIFACVTAILLILVGVITVTHLPVAQYPDITPPTVMVIADYPGADAATVAQTVGIPIEEQVNGVDGMMYMSSQSGSDGSYMLTITFDNGTDINEAAVKVQNRVAQANPTLPTAVKEQGVQVVTRSSNIILFVALESDDPERYDALYLTNYAALNLVDPLTRVKGVGQVAAFGSGDYSMRIWLDADKMRMRGLTPQDVAEAIQAQNMEVSAGAVGQAPLSSPADFSYTLTVRGRLADAEEFGNIVLRSDGKGRLLHLRDVARIDLGSTSYSTVSSVSGHPAGLMGVFQLPGANALEAAKGVEAELEHLAQFFPEGVHYRIVMNSTEFVTASIDEVLVTFVETTLIVMVVILLFLQNWRAVIIPMLTIPVSLIATFAVMKLLGFSLNTLTLFGLVLAIAIVVDDAIVVVEDCARLVDEGKLNKAQSADKAMTELQGPIVGEVLVLLSVFIPTAFISGITGELYKQFALTIATATAISGFNALTFTPAMCALFLKPRKPSTFFVYRWWTKGFGATLALYMRIVTAFLKRPMAAIALYLVIVVAAFWGFMKWPTSYVPSEDMGYFVTSVQLPTDASLERTQKVMDSLTADIMKMPQVADVISATGQSFLSGSGSNVGSLFVVLKPWKERKKKGDSVDAMVDSVNMLGARYQEAIVFSLNMPPIPGLGNSSGLQMNLQDINNYGSAQLADAVKSLQEAVAKGGTKIESITSTFQGAVPQYQLKIDRDKVEMQGLDIEEVFATLSGYMGGQFVNDFVKFGRVYQVNLMSEGSDRERVDGVMALTVKNAQGGMVPFASFTTLEPVMGDASVSRYNMYTSASITATPAKGVSSSTGIAEMESLVKATLGNKYGYAWTGEAYQETQSGTTIAMVLIFAIVITILVLAAQYESWTDPIAVVLSMPTAILGTVIGCMCMDQSISIYTQIGIILLLGLSAKNAILIVEYAIDFRKAGADISQAAADAGRIRFRPIMMTALAFVFGVMPMIFATGAGAASRISLGTAVVFGMFVNAVVGTLFVPNFWEMCERFREKHLARFFTVDDSPVPADSGTAAPGTARTPEDDPGSV